MEEYNEVELFNATTMPLSNNEKIRIAQQKLLNGEALSLADKLVIGRDQTIRNIAGYKFRSDCAYRAINQELLEIYLNVGFVCGVSKDMEMAWQSIHMLNT